MIITISGVPGSGKTSVGRILAARLGMPFYSVGELRGKMAMDRGLTLDELNALGEQDHSTDTAPDQYQKELGEKHDNFVIEGRLSWHFIPHSFKILLTCQLPESARRIASSKQERQDEALPQKPEEIERFVADRMASDKRRYETLYGLDYLDKSHYDLVLDTTGLLGPEKTADLIMGSLQPRLDAARASG